MKSLYSVYIYLLALLLYVPFQAHSQDTTLSFEIQSGSVIVTPAFCPPPACQQIVANLAGTFIANIAGEEIAFSVINVTSTPDTGFVLPETPNEDSSGTSRSASFDFDGEQLVVSGSVDQRAFDGPLYEYEFTAQVSETLGFDANDYYIARQDLRRCATPMCGGIFIKSVNRYLTRCPDGSRRDECYVGTTNWDALGFNPFFADETVLPFTPILLKGTMIPRAHEFFGNFGEFIASEAYRPATDNQPRGFFAALINKGIACITSPCFSIDEYVLNRRRVREISGFDLNTVGASEDDIANAYSLFSENSPLIVAGYNRRRAELHGIGVEFIANQLYLPISPTPPQCPEGYSLTNDECTTPYGCVAPSIELMTVGGNSQNDPASDESTENVTYSCVESCDSPASISGPARCTVELSDRESSD